MANKTKKNSKAVKRRKKKNKGSVSGFIKNNRGIIFVCAFIFIISTIITCVVIGGKSHIKPNPFADVDAEYVCGIDVSHHNGKIDWETVSSQTDFAIIRVGARGYAKGNIIKDRCAQFNFKQANKVGIPVGAYFYTQAITPQEAEEEAKFAIKTIKNYDISLPVFIDFEYAYDNNGNIAGRLYNARLTKQENTAIINSFCSVIRQAGYQCGMYASSYIYKSYVNVDDLDDDCVIWVADYNKKVTYNGDFDIWQYSDKGKVKGIGSKNTDMNYWYLKK